MTGQDLIRAAEIRSTIGQIEKYNTSINAFRSKYNGIPGDISSNYATSFGFIARAGSQGRGDGNGVIEGVNAGSATAQVFTQESGFFWDDLTRANLVDGQFTSAADNTAVTAIATAAVPNQFPEARLGRGNRIHVGSTGGINYYLITGISSVTVTTGVIVHTTNLTPTELFNMDSKLDDGIPLSGVVQARVDQLLLQHRLQTLLRLLLWLLRVIVILVRVLLLIPITVHSMRVVQRLLVLGDFDLTKYTCALLVVYSRLQ